MNKLAFIDEALADLREKGLYNTIRTVESSVGAWVTIEGKRVLNMCSNNYLGFANDPRLCEAAKRAIDQFGVGPGAVRSIAGTMSLHVELEELTAHRRPEVIARIKAARELGDLSENADYEAARKEQSFLEGRVQQLEQMIKSAVMIEASSEGGSEVVLGSTVVVETDRHGAETFTIVGSAEADAASGKISFTSPIGRALLGRHPGETIRVQVPAGTADYKVVEVR